jgi:peptide/nickel transport system ATP-binding protein
MAVLDAKRYSADLAHLSFSPGSDLLHVRDLTIKYRLDSERESAVLKHINFTIASGEIIGLLGESGCGKTTTALSLTQMLPPNAHIMTGAIQFNGHSLRDLNEDQLRPVRGSDISIIYQDSDVLNPVMRVGTQVMEVLRAHHPKSKRQMCEQIYSLFITLGLNDYDRIYSAFPHQLSGGERRRIAIAQALICKPRLVIADEPTAWLDSVTASEILAVFQNLREMYDTAFLLISHDPETLAIADRVMVMYAGEIIESGPLPEVFVQPKHPYTTALLQCGIQPREMETRCSRSRRLSCIPGQAPDPAEILSGCAYSARCGSRMPVCEARHPDLIEISAGRLVGCFKYEAGC